MNPDDILKSFVDEIEAFSRNTGLPASQVGMLACGDPSLVLDLRNGREPGLRLIAKVQRFMREYRSDDAAKPVRKRARKAERCA